jgi:hypothetical protein
MTGEVDWTGQRQEDHLEGCYTFAGESWYGDGGDGGGDG